MVGSLAGAGIVALHGAAAAGSGEAIVVGDFGVSHLAVPTDPPDCLVVTFRLDPGFPVQCDASV